MFEGSRVSFKSLIVTKFQNDRDKIFSKDYQILKLFIPSRILSGGASVPQVVIDSLEGQKL